MEWSGEQRRAVAAVTATVILLPHPPPPPPPPPSASRPPLSPTLTSAPASPPGAGPGSPACRGRWVLQEQVLQKLPELQQGERSALTFGAVTLESVRARP